MFLVSYEKYGTLSINDAMQRCKKGERRGQFFCEIMYKARFKQQLFYAQHDDENVNFPFYRNYFALVCAQNGGKQLKKLSCESLLKV